MNKCPACGHVHGYDPANNYKETLTDPFEVLQQRMGVESDIGRGYMVENIEILVCPNCGTLFARKYSEC